MPQLDFFSFLTQTIWLSIAMCFFYLFFIKYFLAKSTETLKLREKIKGILEQFFKFDTNSKIVYNAIVKSF
jgi:hypothetical protein